MHKIEQMLTSIEVAEMVEKEHNMLLRDIRRYVEQLRQSNIAQSDFFIESIYINSQNKTMPCYKVTKKGCEFIGNKLTGVKGTRFTALYINRFHEMQNMLQERSCSRKDRREESGNHRIIAKWNCNRGGISILFIWQEHLRF